MPIWHLEAGLAMANVYWLLAFIALDILLAGDAGESPEEIGERADQSLLAAKRAGRNRVVLAQASRRN